MKRTIDDLAMLQALPLDVKIEKTKRRIKEWYDYWDGQVYVSFSGGKDSTVLLDLVRNVCGYTDVPAVFVDTGLEYPEIRRFVKEVNNVEWLKPKKNFKQVIKDYGYPFISKEVSNAVEGAKKYLKILTEKRESCPRRIPYAYYYRRIKGLGEYSKQGYRQGGRLACQTSYTVGTEREEQDGDYP